MKKVAIVSGGAKGLGAEIAKYFAGLDYSVVITYRSSKREAQKVVDELRIKSDKSVAIRVDLTSESEVEALTREVLAKFGRVDVLVNNVGNFLFKPFGKTTNAEFRDLLESNIYSTLFVSRAFLPVMRKQKSGQIINIGAVGAERLIIRENSTPYFLGKTGVYVLTKVMAWEEAKHGIKINMISPASMVTDIFAPGDFPMGRSAEYDDVISALGFLTSEGAYYINGANIEVSGAFVPGMDKAE